MLVIEKPAAWYKTIEGKSGPIAVVCSYCPDRPVAERAAQPLDVSHGVCPRCFPALMREALACR